MAADRRNTIVVIALILSMTIGARVLLWLEPSTPRWEGETLLLAERSRPVEDVVVSYVPPSVPLEESLPDLGEDESLLMIYAEGEPYWEPRGSQVRMVVVGTEADELTHTQQATLLWAIRSMSRAARCDLIPLKLATDSDIRYNPHLPPQAVDLRDLLVRKRIID